MIVCSLRIVPTFGLPWATQSHFTAINSRKVGFDTRWGCESKQGIFAGGMGLMSQEFGRMKWSLKTGWCLCWNMVRDVRQIVDIGEVHLSLLNVPREFGRDWESSNAAESEVEARDSECAIEELGHFGDPLLSWFSVASNSVCCNYCTYPAVLWIQSIVFSRL